MNGFLSNVPRRLLVVAVAGIAALGQTGVTGQAASRTTLANTAVPWATSDSLTGSANNSDQVNFRVYLQWQNEAGAKAVAAAVSDPASRAYGQYLTPAQFRAQFAPSASTVAAVKSWLQGQGFMVGYSPDNNHYVEATGTVGQAAAAFSTSFGMYDVQGQVLRAQQGALSVPSGLAASIQGVIGLDETSALVQTDQIVTDPDAAPSAGFVNAGPLSAYWNEKNTGNTVNPYTSDTLTNPYGAGSLPYAPTGYTPAQIRGAYGAPGLDGTGQTVAIIDAYASPTIVQDANQWSTNRGLPTFSSRQFTQVVAPGTVTRPQNKKQKPQGWYGEETLDVEAVHGMAPGADIVYVGAPNNFQDLDAAMNFAVDRHVAPVVTNSYGFATEALPRGFILPQEDTFIEGAATGVGIYFSSGDNSDQSHTLFGHKNKPVTYQTVDWPASSPWVSAIGGTSLAVGSSNDYEFETGWGTTRSRWDSGCVPAGSDPEAWCPTPPGPVWLYGAGGGVSCLFAEPSYQSGVVPAGIGATLPNRLCSGSGRAVPDVAAIADPQTGLLIGQTQSFPPGYCASGTTCYGEFRIGGTSLSSPIMAGLTALINEARQSSHKSPLGFANPAFYSISGGDYNDIADPASTVAVVRDDFKNNVTDANGVYISLRTMNQTLGLHTTAGWDDVTGRGTPTAAFFTDLAGL